MPDWLAAVVSYLLQKAADKAIQQVETHFDEILNDINIKLNDIHKTDLRTAVKLLQEAGRRFNEHKYKLMHECLYKSIDNFRKASTISDPWIKVNAEVGLCVVYFILGDENELKFQINACGNTLTNYLLNLLMMRIAIIIHTYVHSTSILPHSFMKLGKHSQNISHTN